MNTLFANDTVENLEAEASGAAAEFVTLRAQLETVTRERNAFLTGMTENAETISKMAITIREKDTQLTAQAARIKRLVGLLVKSIDSWRRSGQTPCLVCGEYDPCGPDCALAAALSQEKDG